MARHPGPARFGERVAQLRPLLGSRAQWTSASQMASDMGVTKSRYLSWERDNRWPGRAALEAGLTRLESVRARALSVEQLVDWLEFGEGEPPVGGSVVESVSAPSSPMQETVQGGAPARPVEVDGLTAAAVGINEALRTLKAAIGEDDPAKMRNSLEDAFMVLKAAQRKLPKLSQVDSGLGSSSLKYLL